MTKKQKIWTVVFIAMFLLPELLWSTVFNFYYELPQTSYSSNTHPFRDNYFQNSDNLVQYDFILGMQILGLIGLLYFIAANKVSIHHSLIKLTAFVLIFILAAFSSLVFYYVYMLI